MDDPKEMALDILAKALKYYQPVVQLTSYGRRNLSMGKVRHGRLRAIYANGSLSVRMFGNKTWATYHPIHWEFCDQIDERKGVM